VAIAVVSQGRLLVLPEERRRNPRPTTSLYLLWADHVVLDVYDHPALVYAAATEYVTSAVGHWRQTRPNRWYSTHGRVVEIEERRICRRVVLVHTAA
jgi:hypothetical protein